MTRGDFVTAEREQSAAPRLEVVGVGGPGDAAGARRARRWTALRERIGELDARRRARRRLEDVELPAAEPLPAALIEAVGEDAVFTGPEDRRAPRDRPRLRDLARLRLGPLDAAPDAVVLPADAERGPRACSTACSAEGVAVVPFGGGTSVVGGVEPLRGAHARLDQPRPRRACAGSRSTAAR